MVRRLSLVSKIKKHFSVSSSQISLIQETPSGIVNGSFAASSEVPENGDMLTDSQKCTAESAIGVNPAVCCMTPKIVMRDQPTAHCCRCSLNRQTENYPCRATILKIYPSNIDEEGTLVVLKKGSCWTKLKPDFGVNLEEGEGAPTTPTVVVVSPSDRWSMYPQELQQLVTSPQSSSDSTENDLKVLSSTAERLAVSGWYYEGLSGSQATAMLQNTKPGTFLVRNSSDPRYIYTLSVQTNNGPTSVRLIYSLGQFSLDADPGLSDMPKFDCVIKLIMFYVKVSETMSMVHDLQAVDMFRKYLRAIPDQVFIDGQGREVSKALMVNPLIVKRVPSLLHLSRLSVNKFVSFRKDKIVIQDDSLPLTLHKYLKEYPYPL